MAETVDRRTLLRAALAAGLLVPAAPLLTGCGAPPATAQAARSDVTREPADPAALPGAVAALTAAGSAVWARAVTDLTKNAVFSPYSLQVALAMIRFGASGETAAGLAKALHATDHVALARGLNALNGTLASRAGDFEQLLPQGEKGTGRVTLEEANAVWAQQGLSWEKPFLDAMARHFGAGLQLVDYKTASAQVVDLINAWCRRATHDLIDNVVSRESVTDDTRLVLADAAYLKADWRRPFNAAETHDAPFRTASGVEVTARMMGDGYGPTRAGAGWRAAALPYAGEKLAMVLLLPERGAEKDVARLVGGPGLAPLLRGWDFTSRGDGTTIVLPKFEVTTTHDLAEPLAALGADLAFTDRADFSGLTRSERLQLSFATQKALITVDEKGTEAGVVTALWAMAVSAAPPPLRFDRPFYAIVVDTPTATPLFVTYVADPTAKA